MPQSSADVTRDLLAFLWEGPSPYHCVDAVAARLRKAKFAEVDERAEPARVEPGDQGFVRRGGSIIAWRAGTGAPAVAGLRLVGAHTDSPNLRVKPIPDNASEGYRQLAVEPYGGLLRSTWLDRDLGLSGRVLVDDDGAITERLFRTDDPIARIPNLAIHLDRGVNTDGLKLDPQRHLAPVWGIGDEQRTFRDWLSSGLDGAKVLSWDLMFHDVQPPALGGVDGEFVFGARLDNEVGCFLTQTAFIGARAQAATQVLALFDHEEVGSRSATGAWGAFLRHVLSRLVRDHTVEGRGGIERAVANSFHVSVDMAHAVHPNYADRHEPHHKPVINGGPVVKIHSEQRYASDGPTIARFQAACRQEEVACQTFVSRSDLACGSTIGPIAASELGIATVDVGNPMLSMHSCREQCGARDAEPMVRVLRRVLEN
jgi:aspartyl aminopeptidase